MATAGPPHAALLARGRAGAHTGGQNSPQDMYGGLGRGGAANGRALRTLRVDDLQVRPGGAFDPIGDPSVAACAHGASTASGGSPRTHARRIARSKCSCANSGVTRGATKSAAGESAAPGAAWLTAPSSTGRCHAPHCWKLPIPATPQSS